MLSQKIEKILQEVQKPGRYVGGELNSVIKDKNKVLMDKFISDLNDTSFIASPETNESLLIFTSDNNIKEVNSSKDE